MRQGNETQAHVDPKAPHVFETVDLLPVSMPTGPRGIGGFYNPPPTPPGKSVICAICKHPRTHHLHIEGEAAADAETPNWG